MWTATCSWASTLYRSSKYSLQILHTSTSPSANPHFHPLFCCNSPPFFHSHYSLLSKTISYFHSHLDSSSFQTVHLAPFFHTSYFCLFISSSQHLPSTLLYPSDIFYLIIPPHTLWVPPPPLTEPHTSLALSTIACFTCSHICSTLPSPAHLLSSSQKI